MEQTYSILQREVNKSTGQRAVRVLKKVHKILLAKD